MRSAKPRLGVLLLVVVLGSFAGPTPAARAGGEPAVAPPLQPAASLPSSFHPVRAELASIAGVALLTLSDHYVWRHATYAGGAGAQRLSDFVRPIGTPTVLAPPLLAGIVAGELFDRPALTHASVRIGGAIVVAGAATEALKLVVGRSRPYQVLNGDPDETRAFSGNNSFPSGHTTVAFAAAAALDRETASRWVPWVAYPLAGLVGWSRVHDEKHWMSDVVAGAAIGYFAANHAENFMRSNDGFARRLSPLVGVGRGLTVGARYRF